MKNLVKPLDTVRPLNNLSVEVLKSTFEASRTPLIVTDYSLPDNPIIYSNQAFLDLTGYDMDEIVGRNCRFLQGDDSEKKGVQALHEAVHNGTHTRTLIKNYTKDGREFWNDLLISPIRDKEGNITHFMGMQLDVTDRVLAEQRLQERTRELQEANQELEQFTYAASHDLQEPLRMVKSYLQLIEKRYSATLDDDAQTFLAYAAEGADRMQSLIYDLLTLSRISNAEDRYIPTDMNAIVRRALDNLVVMIRESGADISVDNLPTLPVDPGQMTQLFQNLISNGMKYSRPGVAPVISITATARKGGYTFAVRDNGIGIEKQHFERIFVVFQRLHTRTEYAGTGIGLAIVSKIIDRHGGRIWVESKYGDGATFKFTIPSSR
jgi:PAS domain S-box-containing protein